MTADGLKNKIRTHMKHFYITLLAVLTAVMASAQTFTFTSEAEVTQDGVTISFGKGSGSSAPAWNANYNQLRLYASNTVTVSGSTITSIQLYWTKQGSKAYITDLTPNVGELTSGGVSASNTDTVMDTWTGAATEVVLALGASGQRVLTKVVVTTDGTLPPTPPVTGGDDEEEKENVLDSTYVYGEPTIVANIDSVGSNLTYSFVCNNVLVECQKGARTNTYFGCNAGQEITFSATKPIKGIAIDGMTKKGFDVTVNHGTVDFASDAEEDVVGEPVLIIKDIHSTSVTLSCVKQLRCYEVRVYFEANPDEEIGGGEDDEFTYEYEPTEQTTIRETMTYGAFYDFTADYGQVEVYLENENYALDMLVMAQSLDAKLVLAPGTYAINASMENGTVLASPGGDDYYDYPTVVLTDFDEDGTYYTAYYLQSGTVTVTQVAEGIHLVLEGKSYYGSTIQMEYTGALMDVASDVDEVETEQAAKKQLENGQIVIIRGEKKYNVLGAEL